MLRREAVGRRFRPPLWRALPPTRPPGLLPLMKNPIPCHRRQQQPNKPSQIQEKGVILGLGMLTRLWLPVCRAVPARRARDVGIRHVADDGGGPPSAVLLPAGHRSTAVAPPPGSDPRPPAGTQRTPSTPATPPTYSNFNAADSSEHPSARRPGVPEDTLPPHQRRRPEQQQQKPKRSDLFASASAMLRLGMKTAVPHLRPPACRTIPLLTGGGPPSASLLPAGHGLTPATPPVSPSVGLLFNFHGPCPRLPAGPGTPWTGRHLLAPHCPVIRIRRHLQLNMMVSSIN